MVLTAVSPSHSTVTYMCSYLVLHTYNTHPLVALALAAFPPLVMWSRVALGVHTPRQVVVGGTLGLVCACVAWRQWNGTEAPLKRHDVVVGLDAWLAGLKARVTGW